MAVQLIITTPNPESSAGSASRRPRRPHLCRGCYVSPLGAIPNQSGAEGDPAGHLSTNEERHLQQPAAPSLGHIPHGCYSPRLAPHHPQQLLRDEEWCVTEGEGWDPFTLPTPAIHEHSLGKIPGSGALRQKRREGAKEPAWKALRTAQPLLESRRRIPIAPSRCASPAAASSSPSQALEHGRAGHQPPSSALHKKNARPLPARSHRSETTATRERGPPAFGPSPTRPPPTPTRAGPRLVADSHPPQRNSLPPSKGPGPALACPQRSLKGWLAAHAAPPAL